jgi:hypothetical protein
MQPHEDRGPAEQAYLVERHAQNVKEFADARTKKIRDLNNLFRDTLIGGRVVFSMAVAALPLSKRQEVVGKVTEYKDFTYENDPHYEADFGAFKFEGDRYFWKIDYYDKKLENGSEDPADPKQTTRVLTIMLAEEY